MESEFHVVIVTGMSSAAGISLSEELLKILGWPVVHADATIFNTDTRERRSAEDFIAACRRQIDDVWWYVLNFDVLPRHFGCIVHAPREDPKDSECVYAQLVNELLDSNNVLCVSLDAGCQTSESVASRARCPPPCDDEIRAGAEVPTDQTSCQNEQEQNIAALSALKRRAIELPCLAVLDFTLQSIKTTARAVASLLV